VDNFSRISVQVFLAIIAFGNYVSLAKKHEPGEAELIFINNVKNPNQAKDYYSQHLAPGDYYTGKDAAEMKGIWHGRGAEMLHLSGEVAHDEFLKLCDNINPATGEQLTARMKDDRRVLTDFTFDAPKSVTLAYELGGDDRVLDAFRQSVRETMAEIETAAQTRVRKNGSDTDRPTSSMIWAEHIHRTTRPVDGVPDGQLHAHATVFNATFDTVEKKWKAIQLGDIVRDKGYYQAAFHARLASNLKDLGYGIQKDGKSFRLAGIERATVEKFSRRTAIIEAEAERLGIDDAKAKGNLGRRTRENKSKTPVSMTELRAEWDKRLTDVERLALRTAGSGLEQGDATITPEQAKTYALEHSFQNASAVSEKRLKAEALTFAVGSIRPEAVADIALHPEVITRQYDGQLFTTTKTVLRDEVAMLQFAKDGQRKFNPLVTARERSADKSSMTPEPSLTGTPDEFLAGLSVEQKKAALHILNSRDQIVGVRGGPGTGKTHMLQSVNEAIGSRGDGDFSKVFAFAQSTSASGELRKVGFTNAQTLATLFVNKDLQAQLHRQVILLDEAGLASSKEMRELFEIAKRQESRVVLVGDYFQHSGVEAGDAFRLVEKEAGIKYAVMRDIRRQTTPEYKKAVEAINTGTAKGAQRGFDALDKLDWIVEASGPQRHSLLVKDYLKAVDDGKSALIISPTHAEGQKLTAELRETLKERGAISGEQKAITWKTTGWTDAQRGDVRNYEPGMVVEFHQNIKATKRGERGFTRGDRAVITEGDSGILLQKEDGTRASLPLNHTDRFIVYRTHDEMVGKGDRIRITKNGLMKVAGQTKGTRVNNGDIYPIEGITKEGDFRLPDGKIMPKGFGHFTLGYYDTSYKSQSKTVDRIFIAEGKESLPAANQQQWLVSVTRGREQARIYVDSKEDVRNAIARTGQRLSAVELTHTRLRDSWRERLSQSFERNRVGRFLKARANTLADYWKDRGKGRESYA
jgi:conjugative relaxase-like TrwC/TraI family protein